MSAVVIIPGATFDATEHGNAQVIAEMFGIRVPFVIPDDLTHSPSTGKACMSASPVNAHGTYWRCTRAYGHERRCHSADSKGRVYAVWHRRDW